MSTRMRYRALFLEGPLAGIRYSWLYYTSIRLIAAVRFQAVSGAVDSRDALTHTASTANNDSFTRATIPRLMEQKGRHCKYLWGLSERIACKQGCKYITIMRWLLRTSGQLVVGVNTFVCSRSNWMSMINFHHFHDLTCYVELVEGRGRRLVPACCNQKCIVNNGVRAVAQKKFGEFMPRFLHTSPS